jgi:bifunctional non-homologous end joining protein LigD
MPKIPFRVSPMLATLVAKPFTEHNWVFEEKYDGVRLLAYKEGPHVSLMTRNNIDRTARFPEIAAALKKLRSETLALDGEVVVFDSKKISRFQLLQQSKGHPQYVLFDCLYRKGRDLRNEPLSLRRAVLEEAVKPSASVILAARLDGDGLKAFQTASRRGLEGIIAKNLDSRYFEGRSHQWLKVKVHQEDEFVIGGFTKPGGARRYFGALLLGIYVDGQLHYVGKVGTGFDEKTLASLYRKLHSLIQSKAPFASDPPEREATFVAPKLVAQIAYSEITEDAKLRQPVFLGLRDDKSAKEVIMQSKGNSK